MDDRFKAIFDTAAEHDFTHAITCYAIVSKEGIDHPLMHVHHIALFPSVPYFIDFIELFRTFVEDKERFQITDEMISNMFVRVDTMESLAMMLESSYMSDSATVKSITVVEDDKVISSSDDGWTHGIAGNA